MRTLNTKKGNEMATKVKDGATATIEQMVVHPSTEEVNKSLRQTGMATVRKGGSLKGEPAGLGKARADVERASQRIATAASKTEAKAKTAPEVPDVANQMLETAVFTFCEKLTDAETIQLVHDVTSDLKSDVASMVTSRLHIGSRLKDLRDGPSDEHGKRHGGVTAEQFEMYCKQVTSKLGISLRDAKKHITHYTVAAAIFPSKALQFYLFRHSLTGVFNTETGSLTDKAKGAIAILKANKLPIPGDTYEKDGKQVKTSAGELEAWSLKFVALCKRRGAASRGKQLTPTKDRGKWFKSTVRSFGRYLETLRDDPEWKASAMRLLDKLDKEMFSKLGDFPDPAFVAESVKKIIKDEDEGLGAEQTEDLTEVLVASVTKAKGSRAKAAVASN